MTIRVLVADDQSMVRAGFRMLLGGEEDMEVVAEASNGLEAVDKAARFNPGIILMDIRMPELDGLQATRRILAADKAARILILTTFDLDEYVFEALRAGASGFVLKDDSPEQLIAAIRTVAAGDALLSPAITKRVIQKFARTPRPAPPKELEQLSERERDVFRLMTRGLSNAEIGKRALHQRDDREDARHTHPPEAQPPRSRPGSRARLPNGAVRSSGLTGSSPSHAAEPAPSKTTASNASTVSFMPAPEMTARRSTSAPSVPLISLHGRRLPSPPPSWTAVRHRERRTRLGPRARDTFDRCRRALPRPEERRSGVRHARGKARRTPLQTQCEALADKSSFQLLVWRVFASRLGSRR